MNPLDSIGLPRLMALTQGRPDVSVALVDGPVASRHPDLAAENIRAVATAASDCADAGSISCRHGTFIAGVLAARRGSTAPGIAPECTLLVRPVFSEVATGGPPSVTPEVLAGAIVDCVDAGAKIINLSAAIAGRGFGTDRDLRDAFDYTARRSVLVIAAAGNQGTVAGSAIVSHPWVIPVVAYGQSGQPLAQSNLGYSSGTRGIGGPGSGVISLDPAGDSAVSGGTSVAAAFVSGTAALLWSLFPWAAASEIKSTLLLSRTQSRRTIVPPLLDAWAAYLALSSSYAER